MPAAQIDVGAEIEEALGAMDGGMNGGIAPILLPKNQMAFARNATVRGAFPYPRPPHHTVTLNYNGDTNVQTALETGLFQGACFYKPDVGPESLLASISGRLYQFVIIGEVATVFDQTGGNPQSSSAPQCWLWQAEKWVIWNDGLNLPVFFDGNSTRRSLGGVLTVATTNAPATLTGPGTVIALTLTAPYTGPFNVPLTFAVGTFSTTVMAVAAGAASDAFQITLKTLYRGEATEAGSTNLITKPGTIGAVTSATTLNSSGYVTIPISDTTRTAGLVPDGVTPGTPLLVAGRTMFYRFATATTITVRGGAGSYPFTVPAGSYITIPSDTSPNVTVGTLDSGSPYTVPAVGSSGNAKLSTSYTGAVPQIVYAGASQFQVTSVIGGSSSTTLNVQQITSGNFTLGSGATLTNIPELPAGRMGVYGLGRIWMALTDGRSYIAGDIVGGSAGTPAYNLRDSILKITENSYLAGGGVFVVPGAVGDIRAMRFLATLDSSLGQGPLQVLTPNSIFSCNAPIDRTIWQDIKNPIQTISLISNGGLGQNSAIVSNSDLFFRSRKGISSLILARREFQTWGNVPISNEIRNVVLADDISLLPFASAADFDNRLLMTLTPATCPGGVYFSQLAAINFDPLSSMRGKAQSVYDGIWDGMNVLQLVTGQFAERDRCFAFDYDTTSEHIGLSEILSDPSEHFDEVADQIVMELEMPVLFAGRKDPHKLIRLTDGEIYCDLIDGETKFEVFFRPDDETVWYPWSSWTVPGAPTYQPRMGLGECPVTPVVVTGRTANEGYNFQLKLRLTGYARLMGLRLRGVVSAPAKYAPLIRN